MEIDWNEENMLRNPLTHADIKNPDNSLRFAGIYYFSTKMIKKRRRRDSNSRDAFTSTRFPGVRLQPLGHLSISKNLLYTKKLTIQPLDTNYSVILLTSDHPNTHHT